MPQIARTFAASAVQVAGSSGTWADLANAAGKDTSTYAAGNVATPGSGLILALDCIFPDIRALLPGSGAVISQIRCTLQYATNSTSTFSALTGRFWGGSTPAALGSATTLAYTANAFTIPPTPITLNSPTYAQMQNLRLRISGTKAGSATPALYVTHLYVEVDYTYASWSAGASGDYSVWGDVPTVAPPTVTLAAGDYILGTQFEVTGSGKYLHGLRFWRPVDAGITSAGNEGCLYLASGAEVADSRVAFGDITGDPAGGWVERSLPTPLLLAPGEQYVAAIYFPFGIPITDYAWPNRVDGPVRALAGPNARLDGGTALKFPASNIGVEQSYWVDPMVGNAPPSGPEPGRRLLLAT